jgi:hypothetical protein
MLQLANGKDRKPGSQVYKETDVTILFNGPGKYYGYNNVKPRGIIIFSEDLKTAEVDVELKNVVNPKDIIKFNCK